MTDQDRQDIRIRAAALCQHAALLRRHLRVQCASLQDHCVHLAVHHDRFKAFVRQQRSMVPAWGPSHGQQGDPETIVLTHLLARLRRPYAL